MRYHFLPVQASELWNRVKGDLVFDDDNGCLQFPYIASAGIDMTATSVPRPSPWRQFVIAKVNGRYRLKIITDRPEWTWNSPGSYPDETDALDSFNDFCNETCANEIIQKAQDDLASRGFRLKYPTLVPVEER